MTRCIVATPAVLMAGIAAAGAAKSPTCRRVATGRTGHTEAVEVRYDPAKVSYTHPLEVYWRNVDPLDGDGQFGDRGNQYRPAIFTHTPERKALADPSRAKLVQSQRFKLPIRVAVLPAATFNPAEAVHQDDWRQHRFRYLIYRYGCGRDARLEGLWGKPAAPQPQNETPGATAKTGK